MNFVRLFVLLVSVLVAGPLGAQSFPVKPIRIISPYPPGGGNDTLARVVGDKMSELLGQRVFVENKPGANTIIGTEAVAKSSPDGYTLGFIPNTLVINPAFYPRLPYDPIKDFAPVGLVAMTPLMMVTNPAGPSTVKEVIAILKENPGKLSYGTSGNGSPAHLAGLLFSSMTGAKLTHVPYKGTAQAVNDLLAGHIPMMMSAMITVIPQVKAGKIKVIAVTTAKRLSVVPDAPTIAEAGVPGYESIVWYGLVAPAGTPPVIVNQLNALVERSLNQPDVITKLDSQGVIPYHSTAAAFAARISEELPKWKRIADSGVKID